MKKLGTFCVLALFALLLGASPSWAGDDEAIEAPVKGMVTLLDLGANQCIPCRMMEPILNEVKEEYKGRVAVVVVDIRRNRDLASRHGIRVIPTQIFFDKDGKETKRHEGFLDKEAIIGILKEMGVPDKAGKESAQAGR